MGSWIQWFEIPVTDFKRAQKFYEQIFEIMLEVNDFGNFVMGVFPHSEGGGAICKGEHYNPASDGALLYLDGNPDLEEVLQRIEPAGGKILRQKTQISPEHGYMALFTDTEGNRLALHSNT